ncbi:MAG: BamA/TamA family outer membrane protein, partial [Vulcanimicrobiaceae bacterium]
AAEAAIEKLKRYTVPEPEYIAWRNKLEGAPRIAPRIDEVQIAGMKRVNPEAVARYVHEQPGDQLNTEQVDKDLGRIYGDGYYENVDYSLLSVRDRNILRITPVEKSWGPDYLRLGVELDVSQHSNDFALRAAYHKTWVNSLGGEWLSGIQIGPRANLFTEFYQPLDAKQRFFVEPVIELSRDLLYLYQDDNRIAEYQTLQRRAAANIGLNVGGYGQVRLGWQVKNISASVQTGATGLPTGNRTVRGWTSDLDFDQFDRAYFPTKGWEAKLDYFSGMPLDYSKLSVDLRAATSMGQLTFNGRLYYVDSPKGDLPVFDAASLGGPFQLSGFAYRQLIGGKVQFASARAEKIIGKMPTGLHGDMRAGLSLETGRVDQRFTETALEGWQRAVSVYLGGETPVGPVYLGYGRVLNGGPYAIYLLLGLMNL